MAVGGAEDAARPQRRAARRERTRVVSRSLEKALAASVASWRRVALEAGRQQRPAPASIHTFQNMLRLVRRRMDKAEVGQVADDPQEPRLFPPLRPFIFILVLVLIFAVPVFVASPPPLPRPLSLPFSAIHFHLVRRAELEGAPPLAQIRKASLRVRLGERSIRDRQVARFGRFGAILRIAITLGQGVVLL